LCIESPPVGIAAAGPVGVDHSIELPTGPQGIAAAGPVGADHSRELQIGPPGIHRGDCIEYRPAGDRSCWPWFADVLQMFADVCILHTSGHWIRGCANFRPWDPWLCIESPPVGIAAAGPVGVDHSIELPTGPQGIAAAGLGLQTFSKCMQTSAYCWP
jgi:hypothetical protein